VLIAPHRTRCDAPRAPCFLDCMRFPPYCAFCLSRTGPSPPDFDAPPRARRCLARMHRPGSAALRVLRSAKPLLPGSSGTVSTVHALTLAGCVDPRAPRYGPAQAPHWLTSAHRSRADVLVQGRTRSRPIVVPVHRFPKSSATKPVGVTSRVVIKVCMVIARNLAGPRLMDATSTAQRYLSAISLANVRRVRAPAAHPGG